MEIEEYLQQFDETTQERLGILRQMAEEILAGAEQLISYKMLTFRRPNDKMPLLYLAGYKQHIGFYPNQEVIAHFAEELTAFEHTQMTIKLPAKQDLPLDLLRAILLYNRDIYLKK